jgi:hypothetical protein
LYGQGAIQWFETGQYVPAGRLLVGGDEKLYGYARKQDYYHWSAPLEYELYATDRLPATELHRNPMRPESKGLGLIRATVPRHWQQER